MKSYVNILDGGNAADRKTLSFIDGFDLVLPISELELIFWDLLDGTMGWSY